MNLKELIRKIPDFPKQGITFWDITPLLGNRKTLNHAISEGVKHYHSQAKPTTKVVAPESRGFILGCPIAVGLDAGFVPIRKPGKLPASVLRQEYGLEYGTNTIEMHADAIEPGDRVLLVDDVLATGGTAKACAQLVERCGGTITGMFFLLELTYLTGRTLLDEYDVFSLVQLSQKDVAGS
jgi:adenine phosphoribosyltransferase